MRPRERQWEVCPHLLLILTFNSAAFPKAFNVNDIYETPVCFTAEQQVFIFKRVMFELTLMGMTPAIHRAAQTQALEHRADCSLDV